MGVKGLQNYCENHSQSICCKVSIPQFASYHPIPRGERPVLCVDGMGLIHKIVIKERDWAFGGQWREYVSNIKNFVRRFEDAGIELVFFYDGPTPASKMNEWISRRLQRTRDAKETFRLIKSTGRHPPKNMFQIPASMGSLTRYILMFECNCRIYSTVRDADQEISDYANRNPKCFAILGQDSDYMIYDTKPYLSISHLNIHNLTTVLYDRQRLASEIGLRLSQLPLLSCMLGNDVIQVETLRPFHRSLCNPNNKGKPPIEELIPKIGKLIRCNAGMENDIPNIARFMGIEERLIRDSLTVYAPIANPHRPPHFAHESVHCSLEVLSLAFHRGTNGKFPASIYTLLAEQRYSCSELLEEGMDMNLYPAALIFRPIRRRTYALLFDTNGPPVEEWCAYQGNSLEFPEIVTPLPLDFQGQIPPLQILWSDQPQLNHIRWRLFLSCLGVSLSYLDLQKIPLHHVTLCCLLNYLLLRNTAIQLTPWEVAAFILQAISPHFDDPTYILQLRIPYVMSRAVHLASVFLRGVATVDTTLAVCGHPYPFYNNMPWHYFDGKLFHYYYGLFKNGARVESLCKEEVTLCQLSTLYNTIVKDTPLSQTAMAYT